MSEQLEFDYDVFISYNSDDKEWVRGVLLKEIEKNGLRAFIDFRDFKPGAPSIKEMERGVMKSRKTIIVLTSTYIESGWCEIENIMLQTLDPANHELRLIPLLKTQCAIPLRISAFTHIDFTDGSDLDLAWYKLLTSLNASPDQPTEKAIPTEIQAELDKAKNFTNADKYFEAIPILEKALIDADTSGHNEASVKVRLRLAQAIFNAREDFFGAERHFRDALVLVPIGNLDLKHCVLHGLGDMLLFSGQLDEAKATIQISLNIAKLSGKIDHMVHSLISSSSLENALGFHDSAVEKLDEAVQILLQQALLMQDKEKKQHANVLAVCYSNKAMLCHEAGDLEGALMFYGKAEEQDRVSGDKLYAGKTFLFRGGVHCESADWEKGFDCFRQALELFKEAENPLWGARALESISRLFATHERWEEALQAMLGAVAGAEEAMHPGEQVHFLCLTAKHLREWKSKNGKDKIAHVIHMLAKDIPPEKQPEGMSDLCEKVDQLSDENKKDISEDEEVRDLLNQAKEIAKRKQLHEHLADCLLEEAQHMMPKEAIEERRNLVAQAIELLKESLRASQLPKHKGHLMCRLSALYRKLGDLPEALYWLKKAGEVFEKSGDPYGLANLHASLAEMHQLEGRFGDAIDACRKTLSIIEGRSFHELATVIRINLAAALQYRREYGEAQKLLNEAEVLCERHHFKDFIAAIARNRSEIELELQAAQAPKYSLSKLLGSLHQLLKYSPEHSVAYLPFWYFAWNTELLALMRSGPHLSFMVVTDNVDRFMRFAAKFRNLADHFLMATSNAPTIKVDKQVLPIPPTWRFPLTFPIIFNKRTTSELESIKQEPLEIGDDSPPDFQIKGPAAMLPLYIITDLITEVKHAKKGAGYVMALSTPYLPQEAIDLMIKRTTKELIKNRTLWVPTDRVYSKDPFLTDLMIGYERGLFPVYFDTLPSSDAVSVCGGVKIMIPAKLISADDPSITAKWGRALMKLTKLSKEDAQAALLDLPEVFGKGDNHEANSTKIEIRLFEFDEIDQRVVYPAILIRG